MYYFLGVKKISANPDDDEGEPEYKFEWQRTWGHAPKESYLADGDSFAEQPFGIQVGKNGSKSLPGKFCIQVRQMQVYDILPRCLEMTKGGQP